MTTKIKAIVIVGVWSLALLALVGLQSSRLHTAQAKLETKTETIERQAGEYDNLSALYAAALSTIELQRKLQADRAEQQRQLQTELNALASQASEREQTLARLHHENEALRAWADQPLPAWVRQHNRHPSFTSAADYQQHLQHAGALPASSQ